MHTPTGAEPRWSGAQIARAVLDQGQASDAAFEKHCAPLSLPQDRALTRRLVHALMRDWPMINQILSQLLKTPLKSKDRHVYFILAIALAELRQEQTPEHAAVNSAVEATRLAKADHLAKLVNAILRRYLRERADFDTQSQAQLTLELGYPQWLIDAVTTDWPEDSVEILTAGNQSPPLTLRVNTRHWSRDEALAALEATGIEAFAVEGLADAVMLKHRMAIRDIPEFMAGAWSVQDASAQWTADWLQLAPGQRVLDACAGPGGKAAHILERCDVDLVAVELDRHRLDQVASGLSRLGLSAELIAGDACTPQAWWDGQAFDRVLIDAPCSATGVIRRHPDIRWLRKLGDLEGLVEIQSNLLEALWPLVKPGGILVYVTCSVLARENHQQVTSFLERHDDARLLEPPKCTTNPPGRWMGPGWQVLPGQSDWDGFYFAALGRV